MASTFASGNDPALMIPSKENRLDDATSNVTTKCEIPNACTTPGIGPWASDVPVLDPNKRVEGTGSDHHSRCRVPHVVLREEAPALSGSGGRRTDSARGKLLSWWKDGAHGNPRPALSHRIGPAPSPYLG